MCIFPPLRAIINEERISDRGWSNFSGSPFEDVCSANIQRFRSSRIINQSSLAQLLLSFFDKFSDIRTSGSDYSISTYEGRQKSHRFCRSLPLIIEDPFKRMENAARTVRWVELPKISNAFKNAHNKLSSGSALSDHDSLLSLLTRPFLASKFCW
ncbi:protein HESO1-like [Zingiber officinale]|uniref:protein HESO1-like n=1 Tax=Zingiber officinale TaxID=94328 RepID=UPI001C4D34B7|nr:protein HESO1-like [Zingiber officinale]